MRDERLSSDDADQLREEAAGWFAAMRGPDAESVRPAFEAWLALGALHRHAYNRIGETFSLGKHLKDETILRSEHGSGFRPSPFKKSLGPAALLASGLFGGAWVLHTAWIAPSSRLRAPVTASARGNDQVATLTLSSNFGQIRQISLQDGTRLTLDTNSVVLVDYGPASRFVRLEHGRARFDVARDDRPFRVAVGKEMMWSRGAQFDVERGPSDLATVHILRGTLMLQRAAGRNSTAHTINLLEGQQIDGDRPLPHSFETGDAIQPSDWPHGLIDFNQATLADVAGYAARYSKRHIVLADPELRGLRVSGTFHVSDPAALSARLAEVFNLDVETAQHSDYVLRRP